MREKVRFRGPFFYKILYTYASLIHRLYYRRITVVGYEKIPPKTPVIFAPNHQNALMDALAVLFPARRAVVFMARADIFKKPFIAKLLNFLRILPIYRIRDGYGELGRNQEVFEDTVGVLKSNTPICILPEGNHQGQKRLRQLKKGIFRIAFQAEESVNFNLNLHIIPVGIDYSDYFNAGSDLMVVFGTPIKIADYAEQYRQNEQKTINGLMKILTENLRNVMIHIPEEHYQLTYQISEMYEPNVWNTCNTRRKPYNKLTIRQYIIQKLSEAFKLFPEKADEIGKELQDYNQKLGEYGLADCFLVQEKPRFVSFFFEILLSVLLVPFHVYGVILNYFPYKLPIILAKKVKDLHFRSSIQFGISMFLFPICYIIIFIVFCLAVDENYIRLAFALTLPVSGLFALYYYKYMKKLWGKLRLFSFRLLHTEQYIALRKNRNQVIELIKSTINS